MIVQPEKAGVVPEETYIEQPGPVVWHRRAVLGSTLALLVMQPAQALAKELTVLFVCQFGSVKSATAREVFRQHAALRGIQVRALSRGITPEAHFASALKAALAREGLDPESDPLTRLQQSDVQNADITVILDKLPPAFSAKRLHDWTDLGSFNQSYVTERPRLIARIDQLLDELSQAK